jgi:hypothetical protein
VPPQHLEPWLLHFGVRINGAHFRLWGAIPTLGVAISPLIWEPYHKASREAH